MEKEGHFVSAAFFMIFFNFTASFPNRFSTKSLRSISTPQPSES